MRVGRGLSARAKADGVLAWLVRMRLEPCLLMANGLRDARLAFIRRRVGEIIAHLRVNCAARGRYMHTPDAGRECGVPATLMRTPEA